MGEAGQLGTGKRDREMIPQPLASSPGERITDVSAGTCHTCFVTESGALWGFGGNSLAQLGIGNKKAVFLPVQVKDLASYKIKKVSCGIHTSAITCEGELYIWGTGVFGEFLRPQKIASVGVKIKDAVMGGSFGIALDQCGKLWTWGANTSGELGLGDYEPKTSPCLIERLQSKTVVSVSCGGSYAIALGVTHSDRSCTKRSKKMESVITQVLNRSSCDSGQFLGSPTKLPEEKVELEPEENSKESVSQCSIESHANIPDTPQMSIQNQNSLQEVHLASELNTADIISSFSGRDPNQPVFHIKKINFLVAFSTHKTKRLFGRNSGKREKRKEKSRG